MATGDSQLECSLCLDKFKDPRILSCIHTYCRQCIGEYVAKSKRVENFVTRFNCPICRACITLPANGVDGLQKNFYLDQEQPKHPVCGVRKTEDLRFFCHVCGERICRDCKVVSHDGHAAGMADDVATEMRRELDGLFTDTERAISENEIRQRAVVETDLGSLETTLSVVEINAGLMRNEIERLFVFTKNLLTPYIKSKKKRACNIEKAYAEIYGRLNAYKDLLTEADSKGGRDVFQIHKNLKDKVNDVLALKEIPLSLNWDSDEGSIDNTKLVNMFDRLLDILRQQTTQFKCIDFNCNVNSPSVSGKRSSIGGEDIAGIPVKKQKQSDVRDINHKYVYGNTGTKLSVLPSSTGIQTNTSEGVKSPLSNLPVTPISVRRTHEVKHVLLQSPNGLKTVAASRSNCASQSTGTPSNAFGDVTGRYNPSVLTSKLQAHDDGIKASHLMNAGSNVETTHLKENICSNSTPILSGASGQMPAPRTTATGASGQMPAPRNTATGASGQMPAPRTMATGIPIQGLNHYDELVRRFGAAYAARNGYNTFDPSQVKLNGGGTYREGEIYLVKNNTGEEKKMVFTSGRLVETPRCMPTTSSMSSGTPVVGGTPVQPGTPVIGGTPVQPGTPVIGGTPVQLNVGDTYQGGYVYRVRNKNGEIKEMTWTGKTLVELKGSAEVPTPPVPASQLPVTSQNVQNRSLSQL